MRRMAADEVKDGLEELQQLLGRADAADDDPVPPSGPECSGDPSLDVVTPVETDEASVGVDAAIGEARHATSIASAKRLRVPGPGTR